MSLKHQSQVASKTRNILLLINGHKEYINQSNITRQACLDILCMSSMLLTHNNLANFIHYI